MEKKFEELKQLLTPAVYSIKATGRERNGCIVCDDKIKKDDKIIEIFTSSYGGRANYSNRFHRKCFLKVIAVNFPELMGECFDEKFKSKILLMKIEGEN